ncbi:Crp/Fnr family transcriptional regulator [Mycobacterium sp. Marseille-P9652]|uniref:Crp/Fnr family transcriptional regulator n=1 Tax=Mycobacterium sp. Marseille-P9652 TaxID=2654950 RepID=UPI0012E73599|nr:Crp/Fnr family transcriptional regulator [Mycobacterium sp. Marseille-P9652]
MADVECPGVHPVLAGTGILRRVQPDDASALVGRLRQAEFPAGETIFTEGEPGDRIYVVVTGRVKLSVRGPGGRTNLRAIVGPTEVFGEVAVFDPGPRTCSATAITDVVAMWLDRATLRDWVAHRPAFAEQLLYVLSRRLRDTDDDLVELVSRDVAARVARQLLLLARRFGAADGRGVRVAHELSQDEMAQLVGADRTSVNRALRGFASRGWIVVEGKAVLILDSDALTRRAAGRGPGAHSSRRRRPLRATA